MPRDNNKAMNVLFEANLASIVGAENIEHQIHSTGSSDFGDVMHLVPGIHPYVAGATGGEHSPYFQVTDPETLYIASAKTLAMTAIDLLANGAEKALEIKAQHKPIYANKEEYLAAWEELMK